MIRRTCRMIFALILPLLLCGEVQAEHSGPYVGAYLGGGVLTTARSSDDQGDFGLTFKPALLGSAVLGWDFEPGNPVGEGRAELEYTRRRNSLDQAKYVQGNVAASGKIVADSLLFNFYGVFHDGSRWAPYFGLGIGAARIEASDLQVTGKPLGSGSAVVFAYQLGAGIDVALTDYLNLDIGYRLFSSARPKFTEADGRSFQMDYLSHSAVLGLRVGF